MFRNSCVESPVSVTCRAFELVFTYDPFHILCPAWLGGPPTFTNMDKTTTLPTCDHSVSLDQNTSFL